MGKISEETIFNRDGFFDDYLMRNKPVVYRGYARGWPAVKKWTPEYLGKKYGKLRIKIAQLKQYGSREAVDKTEESDVLLAEYISALKKKNSLKPLPYLRNVFLKELSPALLRDTRKLKVTQPNWMLHPQLSLLLPENWLCWYEFFLSPPFKRYPIIHQDIAHTYAWLIQVHGRKKVWLWPGSKVSFRPPEERLVDSKTDLDTFFPECRPLCGELGPGDLLFIPKNWWHTVESQTESITLSGNWVNQKNWLEFFESYFLGKDNLDQEQISLLNKLKMNIFKELSTHRNK